MDILAHGLWTNAVYRAATTSKNLKPTKKQIWTVIFFGLAPDLFSFGPFFVWRIFQSVFGDKPSLFNGPPDPSTIPHYIYNSYNYTHSLIIFLAIFGLIWLIKKKPYWLMFGWGLHILTDIFSHSTSFFPTPFLFPISDVRVNGWSWGHPTFMMINYSLLVIIYFGLYFYSKKERPNRS